MKKKLLSVIVPAYKQAKTIRKDLQTIEKVLLEGLKNFNFEIICVIDGEPEETQSQLKNLKSKRIKVFSYLQNRGKGFAVRYGIMRSKGELVSFIDAGREISPASIMMLMSHMTWYNADIIVGSKRHPVSRVNYPFLRRVLSIGYHIFVKILFGLPLTDTQSGIKIFKKSVLKKVLPRMLVKKYAMDIEILAVARALGFKRIFEAPLEVKFDKKTSRISWKTVFRMFLDTLGVYFRIKTHFYAGKNIKRWLNDSKLKK